MKSTFGEARILTERQKKGEAMCKIKYAGEIILQRCREEKIFMNK